MILDPKEFKVELDAIQKQSPTKRQLRSIRRDLARFNKFREDYKVELIHSYPHLFGKK
jgi:hypothetical protein